MQRDISTARDAAVASYQGEIVFVGPSAAMNQDVDVQTNAVRIDARGCTVVPGFVDPHTHLVYAGSRGNEFERRLAGATYGDIAAGGGGIMQTVAATRAASEDELFQAAWSRLDQMAACGTTTCEAKSGYGLNVESELRQLRVVTELDARHTIDVVPTFLGAHGIPLEYESRPDDYVALVINEMIPKVAQSALAEWCDVFCDQGAFTPQESVAILTAAIQAGLKPRIHAEEFAASGGTRVAAKVGARSADHLIFVDEDGMRLLAEAGSCAVLLPIAAFYLKIGRFAPARMLIDRGIAVALATDLNPGAGYSPSMPFAMALGCCAMQMTLEEALIAATLNAAWSLERSDKVGSLEPGKLMDAVLVEGALSDLLRVPPPIRLVVKRGETIFRSR
jgi:imidazolonepropionase